MHIDGRGKPCSEGCESGIAAKPIERDTGHEGDATNIPVEHQHRYGRATENSVAFYLALHKAGVPAELHIFADAPHAVGLYLQDPSVGEWGTLLRNWLRERGFEIRLIPNLSPTKSAWVLRQAFVDLNAYALLCGKLLDQIEVVGASGFEPPTSWSRTTQTKI